jgi:hypothetical protein
MTTVPSAVTHYASLVAYNELNPEQPIQFQILEE